MIAFLMSVAADYKQAAIRAAASAVIAGTAVGVSHRAAVDWRAKIREAAKIKVERTAAEPMQHTRGLVVELTAKLEDAIEGRGPLDTAGSRKLIAEARTAQTGWMQAEAAGRAVTNADATSTGGQRPSPPGSC